MKYFRNEIYDLEFIRDVLFIQQYKYIIRIHISLFDHPKRQLCVFWGGGPGCKQDGDQSRSPTKSRCWCWSTIGDSERRFGYDLSQLCSEARELQSQQEQMVWKQDLDRKVLQRQRLHQPGACDTVHGATLKPLHMIILNGVLQPFLWVSPASLTFVDIKPMLMKKVIMVSKRCSHEKLVGVCIQTERHRYICYMAKPTTMGFISYQNNLSWQGFQRASSPNLRDSGRKVSPLPVAQPATRLVPTCPIQQLVKEQPNLFGDGRHHYS